MKATSRSARAGRVNLGAKHPCLAVAAAARLRAKEQARLAHAAQSASEMARHLEQQDHLLALADAYEALASSSKPASDPSPERASVSALTKPRDPF